MNLFLFHSLTQDPVVEALLRFRETGEEDAYYQAARGLIAYAREKLTEGSIIKEYILHHILESENMRCINQLRDFLREDIRTVFHELLEADWDGLCREKELLPLSRIPHVPATPRYHPEQADYVRSLEIMLDCSSNEALVGALLAHEEAFHPVIL